MTQDAKQSTPSLRPAIFGGATILIFTISFAIWSLLAPLNGAVIAKGLVKTEFSRKAIQHPDGGIIKKVLVRDGEQVRSGQPLIELENINADSNYSLIREMAAQESVTRERLDAEQQFTPQFEITAETKSKFGNELIAPAFEREQKIFLIRRASIDQQLEMLKTQLQTIERERQALQTQIQASREGVRLAEEELVMNRSLEEKKFVSKARLLTIERAAVDYRSKLGEHEAEQAQLEQRANDVKLRMNALRNDYQRVASEEFKQSNARLSELLTRLQPITDMVQRKTIYAPVGGKVVGVRHHTPGEVAGPRDVLMEIVPNNENLVLEAQVPLDSIKDVHVNQPADIRFTAFKSRTTPTVAGKVTYVSADALTDRNGTPYFEVHVRPDAESIRKSEIDQLQPGMAAEVFLLTEARTTADYLLSPLVDALRRAMRER